MDFRLLGPVEVVGDGGPVELRGAKPRTLVAALVLRAGEVVPVDGLVDALWGERPPRTAVETLHGYVSGLRRALVAAGAGSRLVTKAPGYVLHAAPEEIDVRRFERLAGEGRDALLAGNWATAAARCAQALAEWRGPPLSGAADLGFAHSEVARLDEARRLAVEDRCAAELALGRHAELVGDLERLTTEEPLREQRWAHLITALYRSGRQADALRAYQSLRRMLATELGIEPSPALQRLERDVLDQNPGLDAPVPPTAPAPAGLVAPGLPLALTSFVGRRDELTELEVVLEANRLVTLTGMGGAGKSRLALELAGAVAGRHPDGVYLVELAPVSDPERLTREILRALGLPERPGADALETVVDHAAGRHLLLLLDNCEHLVDACAAVVEQLLRRCAGVRVLATSREPLLVPGEVRWRVRPLSTPEPSWEGSLGELHGFEAPQLFVERVAQADQGWRLTAGDVAHVVAICRCLDGMPLAIELAAAQARALPIAALATRLADRFELLDAGWRNAPARHRTLRSVLDSSHELLDDAERALLARLSVFAGGWTLDAAEQVCGAGPCGGGEVRRLLVRLVDTSLVVPDDAATGRYRLLETVREYAREKLAASGAAHDAAARHAAYFVEMAERVEPDLHGPELRHGLDVLEAERESFHAAVDWLAEHDRGGLARLAAALWRYCYLRGHYREGRDWLERAVAPPTAGLPAPTLAKALHGAGALALYECDYARAGELCERSLALHRELGDCDGIGRALNFLGAIARERGDYEAADALHEEAFAVADAAGDAWAAAHALQMSGLAAWLSDRLDRCAGLSGASLERFRALGDAERIGWALVDLAAVAMYSGDHDRAASLLDESLGLFTDVEFKEGVAWALNLRGVLDQRRGDLPGAAGQLAQSLAIHLELGDRWRVASVLEALAGVLVAEGDAGRAARLLGAADRVRAEIGTPAPPVERAALAATRAALDAALGPDGVRAERSAGAALPLERACALALAAIGARRAEAVR